MTWRLSLSHCKHFLNDSVELEKQNSVVLYTFFKPARFLKKPNYKKLNKCLPIRLSQSKMPVPRFLLTQSHTAHEYQIVNFSDSTIWDDTHLFTFTSHKRLPFWRQTTKLVCSRFDYTNSANIAGDKHVKMSRNNNNLNEFTKGELASRSCW